MVNRVSVARMALFGEFDEFREQKRPSLFFWPTEDFFGEAVEKVFIACQKPAVQKRQMKFGVVLFDAFAFLERAPGRAHAETEIPQRAGEIGDQRTKLGLGFFIAEEEKNIEIRVGEKQAPPVAAQRNKGKPLRLGAVHAQNLAENLLSGLVGQCAKSL